MKRITHVETLATNANAVTTENLVMGRSLRWILIRSGCQFVRMFARVDVSAILDIIVTPIAVCVCNHTTALITTPAM